ncbi:MAG TPA: twin-arginine translocation pathway signal protein, partial [Thermodesulfobacteriota bacterium]|nr:twin-arginine translocation pathway signal protein [Thermodesulfobacteriota bacterium]
MTKKIRKTAFWIALGAAALLVPTFAAAESAADIDQNVNSALEALYAKSPSAKMMGDTAKGILVFPGIYKAGFIVGGQYGEGALLM